MVAVEPAVPSDVPAIAVLLEELDRFYGTEEFAPIEERVAEIDRLLFGAQPAAHVLIAHEAGRATGLAAYSFLWPAAGVTSSMYLKELYVAREYRRRGVGKLLMRQLREIAARRGCSRIEWTTDQDNPDAQRFYAALGFAPHGGKVLYRVEPV